MATVRVGPEPNRSRTAENRNRNRNVRDRFRTGTEPRNRGPAGKKLPEPWNRRKNSKKPDQRTADRLDRSGPGEPAQRSNGTGWNRRTGPERVNRPNGSMEPEPEPHGSNGPTVLWNRVKLAVFLVQLAVTNFSINTHHFQPIHNSSLLLLSLLNYLITQLFS